MRKFIFGVFFCVFSFMLVHAQDISSVQLPPPRTEGGKPLMQALKERKTDREFSSREIPLQVLSDLLWAANGINRPDSGDRTAPSAKNMQEIDVYVVRADGVYLFDAKGNLLKPVLSGDIREATGLQAFVKEAPVNLVFVADLSKMSRASQEEQDFYSAVDTGYVSQNVYLFCASEGLATVVRGWLDRSVLAKAMTLGPHQKIILAQTVGYSRE